MQIERSVSRVQVRIACIVGTRPEAIKLAPLIRAINSLPAVQLCTIVTAQHPSQAVENSLSEFGLRPNLVLPPIQANSIPAQLAAILGNLERAWDVFVPDLVLVQGDTTSALGGTLSAAGHGLRVAHLEAGLRTHSGEPFPEEMHRKTIAGVASDHFAPTEGNRLNLERENVPPQSIRVTGNTGIDALNWGLEQLALQRDECNHAPAQDGGLVLLTMHRRENIGTRMLAIIDGLKRVLRDHPDLHIVLPLHPNPRLHPLLRDSLRHERRVQIVAPLSYLAFLRLLKRAVLVVTDSGGVQEEAAHLNKPALFVREVTERTEALLSNRRVLAGTDADSVYEAATNVLLHSERHNHATCVNDGIGPFGDGCAAERIRQYLAKEFALDTEAPAAKPDVASFGGPTAFVGARIDRAPSSVVTPQSSRGSISCASPYSPGKT